MTIYHLYIKTHNITGLKYLGKTTSKDPYKYFGSGTYWLLHLKKHGKEISTEIIGSYNTIEELSRFGLYYSKLWNIVKSNQWANLVEEDGYGGGLGPSWNKGLHHTEEHKKNLSLNHKGMEGKTHSEDTIKEMGNSQKLAHIRRKELGKDTWKWSEQSKLNFRKPKSKEAIANMQKAQNDRRKRETLIKCNYINVVF